MVKTGDPLYAGIDLGGSKILSVIADHNGAILARSKLATPHYANGQAVTQAITEGILFSLENSPSLVGNVAGIGIAAAGAIQKDPGVITHSPHLPLLTDFPLCQAISSRFGADVQIANDANMAAVAEHKFGAGRGISELVFVTISTGIGGGVITKGQILEGERGFAGELGHMSVQMGGPKGRSSNPGAWESLSSGSALARIAIESIESGRQTIMDKHAIDSKRIFEADRHGDLLATEILEAGILASGAALANISNIFDPEMIVIGGGLSIEWDRYIQPAVQIMRTMAFPPGNCKVRVLQPELGEEAGALGALLLVTSDAVKI